MTALAQAAAVGTTNGATNTVVSATFANTPAAGNLLVAVLGFGNVTVTATPWGVAAPDVALMNGTLVGTQIFSKIAGAGELKTVSATMSVSLGTHRIAVYEIAPTAGTPWTGLDQIASQLDAGALTTTLSTGTTPATTTADGVAIASWAMNSAATAPSATNGYTPLTMFNSFAGHKILTATGAQESTLTWTTSRRACAAIATYRQGTVTPPAGGSAGAGFLTLLGSP